MADSTQHWFERNRPPRVQITYDVEIGNAIEKRELPLVVGVLADLSGNPEKPLNKMAERRFVDVDRDNFNDVMKSIAPRLVLQVDNTLSNDGSKVNVELGFKHIDDFDPVAIVNQIAPLKQLYAARLRLRDLLTKLDGNDELDKLLQEVAGNTERLAEIKSAYPQVGTADDSPPAST
ncbi:type VI secretion system protein TssB [Burkholderia lata]|uniref:Type VI secretion system protein TssB n=1 Tax=Burkholderia lata (strain ATCC 17760 / DSM 23089 / LMG 22485 / NCIMB 9086 / R18194 / 383) TaxID=482957 RepID=A0A6P2T0I7_BURL3|nr:type VI secretion system contractile sheath small subunit [Burkholderia lata]VWC49428.1 type VI secretion system protein TssB [Burkholderia lata]